MLEEFKQLLSFVNETKFNPDILEELNKMSCASEYVQRRFKEENKSNELELNYRKAEKLYAKDGSYRLNSDIRNLGKEEASKLGHKEEMELIEGLFSKFKLPFDCTLYKGITVPEDVDLFKDGFFIDEAYVSTSLSLFTALVYLAFGRTSLIEKNVKFHSYLIKFSDMKDVDCIPFGNNGKLYTEYDDSKDINKAADLYFDKLDYNFKNLSEGEILLPSSKFKIIKIEKITDNLTVIHVNSKNMQRID